MNNDPRPERIVTGQDHAPGTVVVRRSVIITGIVSLIVILGFMLGFFVNHANSIMQANPATASEHPNAAPSAVPANPADLGLSPRSDALATPVPTPTTQSNRIETYATASSQDLGGSSATHSLTTNEQPPQPASAPTISPKQRLVEANAAAAESDLKVPLDNTEVHNESRGATQPQEIRRSNNPDEYDKAPVSQYMLERGMVIPATLYTSIDSSIPGTIVAYVNQDVYDSRKQVIVVPRGSRLTGMYASGAIGGQRRLAATWDTIHLPNGHSILLGSMEGIDLAGTSGFGAAVDNHTHQLFAHVVLLSILGAAGQLSQPQNSNSCGSTYCPSSATFGQTIASSVGSQLVQTGNVLVQRDTAITPTLHVVEGAQLAVMVEFDLPLHPWTDSANDNE